MLGTFQKYFSQVATSNVCPSRSARPPQHVLVAVLDPLAHPSCNSRTHCSLQRLRWPNLTFGNLPFGKLHIWEVATWKIVT